MTQFSDLGLSQPVLQALDLKGYNEPTPIQAQAIPAVLEGRDLLGIAQTGTGKTAAFSIPMLQILHEDAERARFSAHSRSALIFSSYVWYSGTVSRMAKTRSSEVSSRRAANAE